MLSKLKLCPVETTKRELTLQSNHYKLSKLWVLRQTGGNTRTTEKTTTDMQKYMVRTTTGLGSSCGACKFLRRKCTADCIFAPYFSYDQAATHFAAVHKVFGASNASRLLLHLPVQSRSDAAITVSYEALARMHDPIYGCVAQIFALQQQVASLQEEIDKLGNMIANSPVGADISGGISQASTCRNTDGIEFSWQQDVINTQLYQTQLSTLLSHQASAAAAYQGLEGHVNLDFPDAIQFEDLVLDEPDPNSLEKLLSGIDQQVFVNYP